MKGSSLRRLAARRQGARRDIRIQNHSRADTVATKSPAAPVREHPSSKDGSRKKGQTVVGDEEGPPCTKRSFARRAKILIPQQFSAPHGSRMPTVPNPSISRVVGGDRPFRSPRAARVVDDDYRAVAPHFEPFCPARLASTGPTELYPHISIRFVPHGSRRRRHYIRRSTIS